jgi:hypothetical protein
LRLRRRFLKFWRMGGQGFVPNEGKGALASGSDASGETTAEPERQSVEGAAPRAGMQGRPGRGAAPEPILERPGTTPAATPGTGGGIGKQPQEQDRSGRVKAPDLEEPTDTRVLGESGKPPATSGARRAPEGKK